MKTTTITVSAAALNQIPLDWAGNRNRIVAALREARAVSAGIVCLPELAITGYGVEDYFFAPETSVRAWAELEAIAAETRGLIASVGLPIKVGGALYNGVALLADGVIAGVAAKQNLASDGVHYESRWFKPWPAGITTVANGVPVGDLLFDFQGLRVGFEICEDAWVAERPGGRLAARGVDVILNPSASPFAFGKSEVRRRFVVEGSRAFQAIYVYANLLGNEAGRIVYDGETLIASEGRLVARGRRFGFGDNTLASAVCDVGQNRLTRIQRASYRPDLREEGVVRIAFTIPAADAGRVATGPLAVNDTESREAEFTRAATLGLFDYLRKSGAQGFVVSLSGGVDSSAVTVLVARMVRDALAEMGEAALRERLGGIRKLAEGAPLVESLLACLYQRSENSSAGSESAARAVAETVGARFHLFDIDPWVAAYREQVEAAVGPLSWARNDIALQNLQARARAPSAWLVANLLGAILLTTSNRSEISVGYATMDGDTAGGFAPIAGVSKTFLVGWLAWMARDGGGAPLPVLEKVLALTPSAELRPPAEGQSDEEDLMPYAVLDEIEREAILAKRSPAAVLEVLRARFAGRYEEPVLRGWVARFFRLWVANQWKRERLAPSFHLDDENLDPRSWCRFPILSGGWEGAIS